MLIYLSLGPSFVIMVESYETLKDIKKRALKFLGINTERLNPELFAFGTIVMLNGEAVDEYPLDDQRLAWDVFSEQMQLKRQVNNSDLENH